MEKHNHIPYLQENIFRLKILFIYLEKLINLVDVFDSKNKILTEKYKENALQNKIAFKSEIQVQKSFLEYNKMIDKLILALDDNKINPEEILRKLNLFNSINNIFTHII